FHDELADKVREGRRLEFAAFAAFAETNQRAAIPDPNDDRTFLLSRLDMSKSQLPVHVARRALYRHLLELRREQIVPRLAGTRSLGASVLSDQAICTRWSLGDGAILGIASNFGEEDVTLLPITGNVLFETGTDLARRAREGTIARRSTLATLTPS